MNSKPLKYVLFGITGSTAAATTITLCLHWAPPEFNVSIEIPVILSGITLVGLLCLAATCLSSGATKPDPGQQVRVEQQATRAVSQVTQAAAQAHKVRYKVTIMNTTENFFQGDFLSKLGFIGEHADNTVKTVLNAKNWQEVPKNENVENDDTVILIKVFALVGARYDGLRINRDPQAARSIYIFCREPSATSFIMNKGEFVFGASAEFRRVNFLQAETSDTAARFITEIEEKESTVAKRAGAETAAWQRY